MNRRWATMFLRLIITNAITKKMATSELSVALTAGKNPNSTPSGNGIFSGRRMRPTNPQTAIVKTQTPTRSLPANAMFGEEFCIGLFDCDEFMRN